MLSSQIHRLSRAPICTTVPCMTNPHVHALTGKAITMFHLNTDETIPYESTHLVLTLSVTHTLLQHGPFPHKQLGVSGQSAHSNLWTSWFRLLRKLLEIPLPRGVRVGAVWNIPLLSTDHMSLTYTCAHRLTTCHMHAHVHEHLPLSCVQNIQWVNMVSTYHTHKGTHTLTFPKSHRILALHTQQLLLPSTLQFQVH